MDVKFKKFSFEDALTTFDQAIQNSDKAFCDCKSIKESNLDDFADYQSKYVYASIMSIVINPKKKSENDDQRSKLAMGYRVLYDQIFAVLKGCEQCKCFFSDGLHLIAILDTPLKTDITNLVDTSANICSLVNVWNFKQRPGIHFTVSIGLHYEKVLNFTIGSLFDNESFNVFIGNAIQLANSLSNPDNFCEKDSIVKTSSIVFQNLKDEYKKFFTWNVKTESYEASLINTKMNAWIKENNKGNK